MPGGDSAQLATRIAQLPDAAAAVLVTHTEPARARAVQRRVAHVGGRPVVSDEDLAAIALTAAALVYLRRIGRDRHRSRTLVVGAISMPVLAPLLVCTGFPDITLWNSVASPWFPLARAARDADVVLDLLGDHGWPSWCRTGQRVR